MDSKEEGGVDGGCVVDGHEEVVQRGELVTANGDAHWEVEIVERIVVVPEVKVVEKIEEVAQVVIKDRIHEVKKVELVERCIIVPKAVPVEKLVDVPRTEYREVIIEKLIEVPETVIEYYETEIEYPRKVDLPITDLRQIPLEQHVHRNVPIPAQLETTRQYTMPKIKPVYKEVMVPIYVPRYIEVPVPVQFVPQKSQEEKDEEEKEQTLGQKMNSSRAVVAQSISNESAIKMYPSSTALFAASSRSKDLKFKSSPSSSFMYKNGQKGSNSFLINDENDHNNNNVQQKNIGSDYSPSSSMKKKMSMCGFGDKTQKSATPNLVSANSSRRGSTMSNKSSVHKLQSSHFSFDSHAAAAPQVVPAM